ncbi:MAG: hypothetical protein AAF549_02575 [Pseudomonadota bacterium]
MEIAKTDKRASENGNVIIIILIAVALVAALTFAVSQGTRSGSENLSGQQADLAALEILDYASTIRNNVRQLKISGCDDTEISFETGALEGYDNPDSPDDFSCHVFHPNGGGMVYLKPNLKALDIVYEDEEDLFFGEWSFFGRHCISEVGNCPDNSHLIASLSQVQNNVCEKINERNNIESIGLPKENWNVSRSALSAFIGNYVDIPEPDKEIEEESLNGKLFGCFQDNEGPGEGQNIFYQVLIVR